MGSQTSSTPLRRTVLVAAADQIAIETLSELLGSLEYQIVGRVSTGAESIDRARELSPDLVLMEVNLDGDMDGIEAATTIREELSISTVFISSDSDGVRLARANQARPAGYLFSFPGS